MIIKTLKTLLAVVILTFAGSYSANAQKIAHVNFEELVSLMPGQDTIMVKLQQYQAMLESQMKAMAGEYETKLADYQANISSFSNIVKQTKEKEIQDLRARIELFQQNAYQDIQDKQLELYEPLMKRAKEACGQIAKEQGYKYVLNQNDNIIIYCEETENILPLVKKKLKLSDVPQIPK